MAYLDTQHTHKRLAGATGVALVHIALALGLAAGLTIKYVEKPIITDPITFDVPAYTPPPPTDPIPDPQPSFETPTVETQIVMADPIIELGRLETNVAMEDFPPFEPTIKLALPIGEIGPVGRPAIAPKAPSPTNGPIGWVTTNDYPLRALQRGWEGDLTYALDIGVDGKVDDCRIVNSSGRSILDDAACRMITRRARFDPATDGSGEVVAGTYRGAVTWMIPEG